MGHPQIRAVTFVGYGTHSQVDAAMGPRRTGEQAPVRVVFASSRPGMQLLTTVIPSVALLWQQTAATGANLLRRVRKDIAFR
ncbi:hypothetical protein [Actinoplanes sp. ATCC 53533]|uniref:hypothetical protein n=1 Tax=Actinoplanes sp. ATCC 53533 TaxID=1288362 RepID=UPI001F28D1B0|nr:hypothetical protein [Actinoplanes sp. ATCC 53533]